jgi:hypothetical protein
MNTRLNVFVLAILAGCASKPGYDIQEYTSAASQVVCTFAPNNTCTVPVTIEGDQRACKATVAYDSIYVKTGGQQGTVTWKAYPQSSVPGTVDFAASGVAFSAGQGSWTSAAAPNVPGSYSLSLPASAPDSPPGGYKYSIKVILNYQGAKTPCTSADPVIGNGFK